MIHYGSVNLVGRKLKKGKIETLYQKLGSERVYLFSFDKNIYS